MNDRNKYLWVSGSPSFKQFHRRILNSLARHVELEFWEYHQTLDEGSTIELAVDLLAKYLAAGDCQFNLIGHGIGGTIALEYVRRYPHAANSLVLLSTAAQPAIGWQSYYYSQLRSLPDDRHCILQKVATDLFPRICVSHVRYLVARLERDLVEAPSNHSLFHHHILPEGGVDVPLMICGSQDDPVVTKSDLQGWKYYLKPTDRLWIAPQGGHFFHHFDCESVADQIQYFWQRSQYELVANLSTSMELN